MARIKLQMSGPFIHNGNMFHDPEPPRFDIFPEGVLTPRQYLDVGRALLDDCKRGDLSRLKLMPQYLKRQRNGILWGSVSALCSYALPCADIEAFVRSFEDEVFGQRDPLVALWLLTMLRDSGIPHLVDASTRLLPYLHPGTDFAGLARIYAIILESNLDFAPSRSAIIRAADDKDAERTLQLIREKLESVKGLSSPERPARVHAGQLLDAETILLSLAESLRQPYFPLRITYEKVLLEAFTGKDLASGYVNLQLHPTKLFDALTAMSDAVDFNDFPAGQRYFFGRQVTG